MLRPPPRPTLFPYTTLFRSLAHAVVGPAGLEHALEPLVGAALDLAEVEDGVAVLLHAVVRARQLHEIGRAQSELQSRRDLVCRLLLEKKKKKTTSIYVVK